MKYFNFFIYLELLLNSIRKGYKKDASAGIEKQEYYIDI
jgi:hypothetical protein